jgi:MinD-like ATPase involved in chromosome partitioning or flagellar assembly
MTVVAFASHKGSPGVTTLACLVAARWPTTPVPFVAECDPAGGDLAARFELSSRRGWTSFVASVRREGGGADVDAHLQRLPGGLDVLVSSEPTESLDAPAIGTLLDRAREPDARDVVVDLGRIAGRGPGVSCWLECCDEIVLVSKSDPASLIGLALSAGPLIERYGSRLGLVVVGPRRHADEEIAAFTGVRLLARIPSDRRAAGLMSGERRGGRRRLRSALVASAERLASDLACAPGRRVLSDSAP